MELALALEMMLMGMVRWQEGSPLVMVRWQEDSQLVKGRWQEDSPLVTGRWQEGRPLVLVMVRSQEGDEGTEEMEIWGMGR